MPQSPYSSDLASTDFHLLPKLKLFLAWTKFKTDEEIIVKKEQYFDDLGTDYYKNGIALQHHWSKVY